jgi:hypothetical protein
MIETTIDGRYYITSFLGEGGFGTTYLAQVSQGINSLSQSLSPF